MGRGLVGFPGAKRSRPRVTGVTEAVAARVVRLGRGSSPPSPDSRAAHMGVLLPVATEHGEKLKRGFQAEVLPVLFKWFQ